MCLVGGSSNADVRVTISTGAIIGIAVAGVIVLLVVAVVLFLLRRRGQRTGAYHPPRRPNDVLLPPRRPTGDHSPYSTDKYEFSSTRSTYQLSKGGR